MYSTGSISRRLAAAVAGSASLPAPSGSDRSALVFIEPMRLTPAIAPPARDSEWAFEVKFDGMRAVVAVAPAGVRVWSRNGIDHTHAFPELQGLAAALGGRTALLDGELVCMEEGRPSFARIRRRWIGGAARAARLARECPATLVAFDLLEVGGERLLEQEYQVRRSRLAELELRAPHWITTDHQVGNGLAVIEAGQRLQFEGVVAKRLRSRYRPGTLSPDWLKIKNYVRSSFLIGGWLVSAAGGIEALFVGSRDSAGNLAFEGTVEFGLERQRQELRSCLELIQQAASPFARWRSARPAVRWARPLIAADVRYIGRDAGVLREAILEGVTMADQRVGPQKAALVQKAGSGLRRAIRK
jgi:bifunctional non-homologous end joining protein LigD